MWTTTNQAWLMTGERCAVAVNAKPEFGVIAQANGDISCVDLDNGRRLLVANPDVLVMRDGGYAVGRG